ncbi:MAG TPA: hypothetical protein PKL64_05790, partial [Bacteroidales bacterium]|nr:hypothetical protein [Bacteroidales bacterium]
GFYKNGKIDGEWNYYDETGKKVGAGIFNNGSGVLNSFFPDGKLEYETHYVNNKKDGTERIFDKKGKIIKVDIFKNGEKQ